MSLNRSKLYVLLSIVCVAGYIWLGAAMSSSIAEKNSFGVCPIKYITNIPCPACGSTRSVVALVNGNFIDAIQTNPLGYFVAIIMMVFPIWILIDLVLKKDSLFKYYQKVEMNLKKPLLAIPLSILIIINWVWNINKGL